MSEVGRVLVQPELENERRCLWHSGHRMNAFSEAWGMLKMMG
jgi:hypothetical protein